MAATGQQYAVIEAHWTERPSERFVISYSREESLRDLIADSNILACGFASHRDAEAYIDASPIAASPRTQPALRLSSSDLNTGFRGGATGKDYIRYIQKAFTKIAFGDEPPIREKKS